MWPSYSSRLRLELLFIFIMSIWPFICIGAPLQESSTDLQHYSEGCYYNYNHYNEGDRILTNEPCLNCTCHNKMLMCYLRVCPFTKPIGHDCVVEKREDQCCPIITCPEVPVELINHQNQDTELGFIEKNGCEIDGTFYPEGAQVPSNPNKPCELCYCIRNRTSCIMQECTLHVDGCQPIYNRGSCCPVRYNCDYEQENEIAFNESTTTVRPTPGFLLTTTLSPSASTECVHDNSIYLDGALIPSEQPCEHCYCMRGDIVCAVQDCEVPLQSEGRNCTSVRTDKGECCPKTYTCSDIVEPVVKSSDLTTESEEKVNKATTLYQLEETTFKYETDKEQSTTIKPFDIEQDLHETISEEDLQLQGHIDDVHNIIDKLNKEEGSHLTTTEGTISKTSSIPITFDQDEDSVIVKTEKSPEKEASTTLQSPGLNEEDNIYSITQRNDDGQIYSIEHTTLKQEDLNDNEDIESSTHKLLPSDTLLTEQTTRGTIDHEIPTESSGIDTYHHRLESEDITELPRTDDNEIIPISIPGEGDCLVNEITYKNNSNVPPENKCSIECICLSSVVICKNRKCEAPPSVNCKVTKVNPDECCPIYTCESEDNENVGTTQSPEKLFENAITEEIGYQTTDNYFTKSLTKDSFLGITTDRPELFYTGTKTYETELYAPESATQHTEGVIFSTTESILNEGIKKSPYDSKESDLTTQPPFESSPSRIDEEINKIESNDENGLQSVSSEGPVSPTKDSRLVQDNLESTTIVYSESESNVSGDIESYDSKGEKIELDTKHTTEQPKYTEEEITNVYESHTDSEKESAVEVTLVPFVVEQVKEEFATPSSVSVKDKDIFTEDTTIALSYSTEATEEKEQTPQKLEHDEEIPLSEENLFISTTIRTNENVDYTVVDNEKVMDKEEERVTEMPPFDEIRPVTESIENVSTKQPAETYVENFADKTENLDNSLKTSTLSPKEDIEGVTQTAVITDSVTSINKLAVPEESSTTYKSSNDLHAFTSTTSAVDVEDFTIQQLGHNEKGKLEGYDLKTEKYDSDSSTEGTTKIPIVNSDTSEQEQSRYPTTLPPTDKHTEETYFEEKNIYQTSSSEPIVIQDKHEPDQKTTHEESITESILHQTSVKSQDETGTEQNISPFNEYTTKYPGLDSGNTFIDEEPEQFIETTAKHTEREELEETSTTPSIIIKGAFTEKAHTETSHEETDLEVKPIKNLPADDKLEMTTETDQTTEINEYSVLPNKVDGVRTTISPSEETRPYNIIEDNIETSTQSELNELLSTKSHEDRTNLQEDTINTATEVGGIEYAHTASVPHSTISQRNEDVSSIPLDTDNLTHSPNEVTVTDNSKQTTEDQTESQEDRTTPTHLQEVSPSLESLTEAPIHEVVEISTVDNLEKVERPNYGDEQDLEQAGDRVTTTVPEVSVKETTEAATTIPIILENESVDKNLIAVPTTDFSDLSELSTSTEKLPVEPGKEIPDVTPKFTTSESIEKEPISTEAPYKPVDKTKPEQMVPNSSTTSHPAYPPGYGQLAPHYPTYPEEDYGEEEETEVFGPGTCRYGGKLFVSAQQIPRDDPCDFCFCFRSDIICLQQSCPPPISGCYEEPIQGFCCPRYECPVSMATVLNVTTSTTTTSTTLPPHFLHQAHSGGNVVKNGCHIQGKSYKVGEKIESTSGPCMHCKCGGDGQMKCDPFKCTPEPMLRQMIAVVASRRR